jgi:hypothetical protein
VVAAEVARGAALLLVASVLVTWLRLWRWKAPPAELHWTERARQLHPLREAVVGFGILWKWLGVLFFGASLRLLPGEQWVEAVVAFSACWLVPVGVNALVGMRLGRGHEPLGPAVLMSVVQATLAATILEALPLLQGLGLGLAVAYTVAGGLGLLATGPVGRVLGCTPLPAAPEAKLRAAIPANHLVRHIVEYDSPNAQALMTWRTMFISSRARVLLSDEELAAVAAHEAGHRREASRRTVALRLGLALAPWAAIVAIAVLPAGVAVLTLMVLGGAVLKGSASQLLRDEESQADACGEPAAVARALEAIHADALIPAVLGRAASHPDLVDRLTQLGHPPSWPVPAPPERPPGGLASILLGVTFFLVTWSVSFPNGASARTLRELTGLPPAVAVGELGEDETVYRLLAEGDCEGAAKQVTGDAPAALHRVVDQCGVFKSAPDCDRLYDTPLEELVEHTRVGRLGEGATIVVDAAFILRQGIPVPGQADSQGRLQLVLRPGGDGHVTSVTREGVGWRGDTLGAFIPWAGVLSLATNRRCWAP